MNLFAEEPNLQICVNCDAEFTVNPVSVDEETEICFCPFCGADLPFDDDDFEDEDDDEFEQ